MRARYIFLSVTTAFACTFPDVTYSDGDSSTDATVDVIDELAIDASDGGMEAETSVPDADDDGNDPCDQDHDGYKAQGVCEGGDCNDNDPRVNPGVTKYVFDIPDAAPNGDWNCDGKVTPLYNKLSCGLKCSDPAGFVNTVACGYTDQFDTCAYLVVCTNTDAGMRTQGCL